METTVRDTDYLYASARIKSLEKNLLSRERLERMCDAKSLEDALKLTYESGWTEVTSVTVAAVEEVLANRRSEAIALIRNIAPDKRLPDVFLIKYDYHNLKVLLKSEATGESAERLLSDSGIFTCHQLQVMLQDDSFSAMSKIMARAIAEARDVLARTQDPQLLDFIFDKAMYADMLELAESLGLQFLIGYVTLLIDSANLRIAVRLRRIGRGVETLHYALIPGGSVDVSRLAGDSTPDFIESVYRVSSLTTAAAIGAKALRGEGSLASLDHACEDTLLKYLKKARYVAFGAETLVGYLVAVEMELTSVRTIVAGRLAGLETEMIKERLRETYV